MRSWEGAPLDAVIAQWEYLDQEQVIAGHKLYFWFYTKSATLPATTTGTVNQIGNTAFITPPPMVAHNVVVRTEWKRNNWPFAESFEYSNWRRKLN